MSVNASSWKSMESVSAFRLEVKKSVFWAEAHQVMSVDEVRDWMERIRAAHPDATHWCYAYHITEGGLKEKAEDDGEPKGTAGMPILEVLRRNELENILLVVTRYFGGVKLGAGGLVRAYVAAATGLLESQPPMVYVPHRRLELHLRYDQYDSVSYFLTSGGWTPENVCFGEEVTLEIAVEEQDVASFQREILERTSGRAEIVCGSVFYAPHARG